MRASVGFGWAALAAATLAATASPATTINFSYAADDGVPLFGVSTAGMGSFTTASDTGTFTAADLSAFSIDGTLGEFIFIGNYSFGLADLTNFSATLAGGAVSSLAFTTGTITVPIFVFSDDISLDVAGLGAGNLTVNSFNDGPFVGDLTVDGASAAPEPAAWAMLVAGFGMVGGALRRRRIAVAFA